MLKPYAMKNVGVTRMAVSKSNVVFLRAPASRASATASASPMTSSNVAEQVDTAVLQNEASVNEFALSLRAETLAALEIAADEFNRQLASEK